MLKAAFFDVGDTLVEHWSPDLRTRTREVLVRAFGERDWYDAWLAAEIEPGDLGELRQETLAWYRAWFERSGISMDGLDLERLRAAMVLPLDLVSTPVPGAFDALRWCKARDLRVVLVTNTLSRGDAEVIEDWRRFGLGDAIDGVVSSHSVGWRKPHRAMFERALELARCRPQEAFMVGDNLHADVWGAKRLGMRAIWRRRRGMSTHRVDQAPSAAPTAVPDAEVDDLGGLPRVVEPWLASVRA